MTKPICLWSGPRNVSTALMYSFAQRNDIRVIDEPLYGHYLRVSGAEHPGRSEVLAKMNCDGDAVMTDLLQQQSAQPTVQQFHKHMAHHLVDLDLTPLQATINILLVRDPRQMLPSLVIQVPDAALPDTGLKRQWELFESLTAAGQNVIVLDARRLLLNPESILRQLCRHLQLEFDPAMLNWEAGPRPEDGVWAPYWYHAVHESTGFAPYQHKNKFPERLRPLLNDCKPWYDRLLAHALSENT